MTLGCLRHRDDYMNLAKIVAALCIIVIVLLCAIAGIIFACHNSSDDYPVKESKQDGLQRNQER